MNSRATRLQPAVEQARQRSEDALLQLAAQQQRLARAGQQLDELQRYRGEYADNGGGSLTVGALLNRQQFVERIDRAIAQQQAEIARLQQRLAESRGHWQQAHARESALDSVVEQYREQARQAEERREQADIDERMQHRRPR